MTASQAPLVSVVTAVRNGARFLPEAIASVRAQSMGDWEYIVVDDASDDATRTIAERAATEDVRIRVIRRASRGGPYVAANDALAVAHGRYVARLDADDLATPDRLAIQLRFLDAHPNLRAVGGFHQAISETGEPFRAPRRFPVSPGVLRWRLCFAADASHSSAFFERGALEEIGGYAPHKLAQDWQMWSAFSRRGWLGMVPEVVVCRRIHADRLSEVEQPQQAEHANDVAREHIRSLTGEQWDVADVQLLRDVAHRRGTQLRRGLAVLDRWAQAWSGDAALSRSERDELERWTVSRRRRYVIERAGGAPVIGRVVQALVAGYDGARQRSRRSASGRGSSP